MIDIALMHKNSGDPRTIQNFLRSKPCEQAAEYLRAEGLADSDILVVNKAHRGSPQQIFAHKLIALEYIRWKNYDDFARRVCPCPTS